MEACEFCDVPEDETDGLMLVDGWNVCECCYHDGVLETEESLEFMPDPRDHFSYFEEGY